MLKQLFSFDELIGAKLVKIVYYLGLIGFVLSMSLGVLMLLDGSAGILIFMIIGSPIGLVFWRIICELSLLSFRMAEDIREIKLNKLGPPPA